MKKKGNAPTSPSAFQERVTTHIRKQKMGVKTWKKLARLGDRTSLTLGVAGAQSKRGGYFPACCFHYDLPHLIFLYIGI